MPGLSVAQGRSLRIRAGWRSALGVVHCAPCGECECGGLLRWCAGHVGPTHACAHVGLLWRALAGSLGLRRRPAVGGVSVVLLAAGCGSAGVGAGRARRCGDGYRAWPGTGHADYICGEGAGRVRAGPKATEAASGWHGCGDGVGRARWRPHAGAVMEARAPQRLRADVEEAYVLRWGRRGGSFRHSEMGWQARLRTSCFAGLWTCSLDGILRAKVLPAFAGGDDNGA